MGTRRIRHVLDLKAGEAVGVDVRADRRKEIEQQFNIRTIGTASELLRLAPDAIFVCVPPAEHMPYLKMAVEQGWHFMTEQPVSHTQEGLDALLAGVEKKSLVTHVSCNKRFHEGVRQIRRWIKEQAIGPVLSGIVEIGEWLPDWHPYEPYTDYYPSLKSLGGGLDAVCDLEWLAYLFGPVSRLACFAGKKSSLAIDTHDVVQMLVEFDRGPMIVLHTDMIQRVYASKAKFIGEKGTIEWDWGQRVVRLYRADSREWQVHDARVDTAQWPSMKMKPGWEWVEPMYLDDTRAFLDRLKNGDASSDSLKEGIANARIVLQALDCSARNSVWRDQ
jgi:predicted dehydrogenase